MKYGHFIPALFIRDKQGGIQGLAVNVMGKRDNHWKYFTIWADNEYPELCVVRHLLIYIYLTDMNGGYMFPGWTELMHPPSDGIYLTHVAYNTFEKYFKTLLAKILPNGGTYLKMGLHMFRKTGYKFAIWGHGLWEAIKRDARHKDDADAYKYAGDSWSTMRTQEILMDPLNNVKKYKGSYLQNIDAAAVDCQTSTAAGTELRQLAKEYVDSLGVPVAFRRDMKTLLKAAMNDSKHEQDSDHKRAALESTLNPAQVEALGELFLQRDREQTAAAVRKAREDQEVQALQGEGGEGGVGEKRGEGEKRAAAQQELAPSETAKKARKGGTDDLEGYAEVSDLPSVVEKLQKICELAKACPPTKELTPKARTWVMRTMNPVVRCLENHHADSSASFCNCWANGKFRMKFAQGCCRGKVGEPCGTTSGT